MRNNFPMYFWRAGDGAGGVLAFGFGFTFTEANDNYKAITQGGSKDMPPRILWVLLNKWNAGAGIGAYANLLSGSIETIEAQGLITFDKGVAASFGIDSVPGGIWQNDSTDGAWQKNLQLAKKRIGVIGKTKAGTFTSTVYQLLWLTFNTLSTFDRNALGFAIASQVKRIINDLTLLRITPEVALARYQRIVDANPRLFT